MGPRPHAIKTRRSVLDMKVGGIDIIEIHHILNTGFMSVVERGFDAFFGLYGIG